jgi:hypothetical protein
MIKISHDPLPEKSFDIKRKWAKEVEFRPGLKLIITDLTFPRHFAVRFEIERTPLLFCFIFSEKTRSIVHHGPGRKLSLRGEV